MFNSSGNIPPLLQQLINQYQQAPQSMQSMQPAQQEYTKPTHETFEQSNGIDKSVYEINSKADLEYIKPDESGRKQVFICDQEKKVYIGKYNHVKKWPDYKSYTEDGEVNLHQPNDTTAIMEKISEALVLIANKLDVMDGEIKAITKPSPYPISKHRKSTGKEDGEEA